MRISDWSSDVCSSDLKAFVATPIAQRGAFLDAVGAYLMTFLAYGKPTREFRVTTDRLAMYASTPAEQDAWDYRHNDEGVTAWAISSPRDMRVCGLFSPARRGLSCNRHALIWGKVLRGGKKR